MLNMELLPEELEFLSWINSDRSDEYRTCRWLKSPFDSSIWKLSFNSKNEFEVDFRVRLEDGSLLTHDSNKSLLDIFKCWICIQTHFDVTGGILHSAIPSYFKIRRVLNLIDYFVMNSSHFKLSEFGLMNVTENDLTTLLAELASSSEVSSSIYKWRDKLTDYLNEELDKSDTKELKDVINKNKFLAVAIPHEDDRFTGFNDERVIYARALLWKNGLYRDRYLETHKLDAFRYGANTKKISQIIYANTLAGKSSKPQPNELLLVPIDNYRNEFNRASVRKISDDQCSKKLWSSFKKEIRSLGQLKEIGLPVPIFALKPTTSLKNQSSFLLKPYGRFRTLPNEVVLQALQDSIEFCLNYGQEILNSVIEIIRHAQFAKVSCITYASTHDISILLSPKVRDFGVKRWHLGHHMSIVDRDYYSEDHNRPPSKDFFARLRKNEGLYELMRVLFGAVQVCVGTVMARRQSELIDLIHTKALDKNKTFMIFLNRKSGISDMREREVRPIPNVAVQLICMLEQFHKNLAELGLSSKDTQLFSYPNLHSGKPIKLCSESYNHSIDVFCDYFETKLNANGERYYIRQHQLRRFFAMMFFWGNSFGGMDTLRWFLGHTDPQHLYHYITESVPGSVLIASKAHYGCEMLKTDADGANKLADVIEEHFGTRNFSILDSDELDEYIEDLLIEGSVSIEPVFFDGPGGKTYRIAIDVKEKSESR